MKRDISQGKLMADATSIGKAYTAFESALADIKRRRDEWKTRTRAKIAETLRQLVKQSLPGMIVQETKAGRGAESVSLSFPSRDSGMVLEEDGESRKVTIEGGHLGFALTTIGRVGVWMQPVYFDFGDDAVKPGIQTLEAQEPDQIDDDFLYSTVEEFLAFVTTEIQSGETR
jgi:hypothetical protein